MLVMLQSNTYPHVSMSCLTHMLVSALAVRALDCTRGTITTITSVTVVAGLGTVLLHVVNPSISAAVAGPLGAITVDILAVRVGVGARVGAVLVRLVVSSGIGTTVARSGTGEGGVAGVVVEVAVVVVSGELDESLVSPGFSPRVLDQDEGLGVSDHGDSVVSTSPAGGILHDFTVITEELVSDLECNSNGSLGQGLQMGALGPGDGGVSFEVTDKFFSYDGKIM